MAASTPSASRTTTAAASPLIAELSAARPRRTARGDAWARLRRNRAAMLGLAIILFFIVLALFAPAIAPHNPLQLNSGQGFLPPA